MAHGQVRWYRFARPDKKRPALILTRSSALEFLGEVTIAPITTMSHTIAEPKSSATIAPSSTPATAPIRKPFRAS